jgi:PH (Pleckstrin Homology) domain-containing protein
VHSLLLKSQGVVVARPYRIPGTAVGAGAAAVAILLALALLLTAVDWPTSFPQFLAYLGAGVLFVVAAAFAFWAYCCFSLRYMLDRSGVTIAWGPIKHFVSIENMEKLVPGRAETKVSAKGLGWWGYHVGEGSVEGVGDVLFFSTHRSAEDLVFVHTPSVVYAVSPQDPVRFIADAQKLKSGATPTRQSGVERDIIAGHPIWADRVAQALAAGAVVLNIALWGFVFAVYPELDSVITIEFPPVGDITTLQSREEILKIPATATAILAVNLIAALAFQYRERAATYLLMSGAVFFQLLFWVAAIVAVLNA